MTTKAFLSFLFVLAPLASSGYGQATPAASVPAIVAPSYQGFQLPRLGGSLQYALSVSELLSTGYYNSGGTSSSTSISGDIAYLSVSKVRPFSMVYSGGYLASTSGQPSSVFQNLALSQVFITRSWNFVLSDSVSYLPETATTGLSGIAGVGDLGIPPIQIGPTSGQGILTGYASRVNNTAVGSVERRITGSTSIQGSGSLILQRFVGSSGNGGIDSTEETAFVGPSHRINARNSISANYTYSHYTFTGSTFSFVTQGGNLEYSHQFSRKLNMDASAGPQRTTSSLAGSNSAVTNLAANVTLGYIGKATSGGFGYSRGTNSGFGVTQGAISDNLGANARRNLGREWNGSVSANYARTSSLGLLSTTPFTTQTFFGGIQASRAVTRTLFAYVSYTAQRQSIQGPAATINAFSGLSQVVGIGLTYSPGSIQLGHR